MAINEEEFDSTSPFSAYSMYYELHNGEQIEVSGFDDDTEYLIDQVRFKKSKRNIKISYKNFSEVKEIIYDLFESDDKEDLDFFVEDIEGELDSNSLELKDIKCIHIIFVGHEWCRNLHEHEKIDIDLKNKTIETKYHEEI